MHQLYNSPGFLGTRAMFLSDLTLVLILISSTLFTLGWRLAVNKHYSIHRWVQTSAAILNALVVINVMIGSLLGYTLVEAATNISKPSVWVTLLHAGVGTIGFLLGIFIVLRANGLVPRALRFRNYKLFMRVSYSLYMLATLIGIAVYIVTFMV